MESKVKLIRELNFILYSTRILFLKDKRKHSFFVVCTFRIFSAIIDVLFGLDFRIPKMRKILIYAPTTNNEKALQPIMANMNEDEYTYISHSTKFLPKSRVAAYSLLNVIHFVKCYYSSTEKEKLLIKTYHPWFFNAIGYYYTIKDFYKKNPNLKLIVFANDHININRCMIMLASQYGVKTIYTQHASVTETFPPLNFTYSFLDGKDSLDKYESIGDIKGKVILAGGSRFDNAYQYKTRERSKDQTIKIGIAFNPQDSIDKIQSLCKQILELSLGVVILRPHPSEEIKYREISHQFDKRIQWSQPSQENSFEFISKINLLIANESSIHLDAAILGKKSVLYNLSDTKILDWYSYIKKGLIQVVYNIEDIKKVIESALDVSPDMIKLYNAADGTPYEGHVGQLIASCIKEIVNDSFERNILESVFCESNKDVFIYK